MRHVKWAVLLAAGAAICAALALSPVSAAGVPRPADRLPARQDSEWRCVVVNGQVELNIRSAPGVNAGVVSQRPASEQIEADYGRLEDADGYNWVPVRFPGGEGWANTARLVPCPSTYDSPDHQIVLDQVNQDGTLDRYEIAAVARSVVLLANVQGRDIVASGSGTIITPDGLIITNAHVVEDAELVAVAILNDINDPPDYQYLAEITAYDRDVDVALIAIRYDLNGKAVDPATLSLPYLPSSVNADQVFRGDPVYIFGYPGIGDDYLVVTSGSIVSVENGEMQGRRLPVWYRTDAEIAPGNSGGLVVNGNGEFIGIPTTVRSENETGGRLGGIRPAQVALMTVLDTESSYAANTPAATATPAPAAPVESSSPPAEIDLQSVMTEQNAVQNGLAGVKIHVAFVINGWASRAATVYARFYQDDAAETPLVNPDAPVLYRDAQNQVRAYAPLLPCCDAALYEDLVLFMPYDALGLDQPGSYSLKVQVEIASDDQSWQDTLSWESVTLTR